MILEVLLASKLVRIGKRCFEGLTASEESYPYKAHRTNILTGVYQSMLYRHCRKVLHFQVRRVAGVYLSLVLYPEHALFSLTVMGQ